MESGGIKLKLSPSTTQHKLFPCELALPAPWVPNLAVQGLGKARAVFVAVIAMAMLVLPSVAQATLVGLSAKAAAPSRCFPPLRAVYASTSCQLFAGAPLEVVALASRDDGSVRLLPQSFTLLALGGDAPTPVTSFTHFDDNDADDDPSIVPSRSTDYQLRFEGNEDMPAATSATMVVDVGARLEIPQRASSGDGTGIRVPATVTVPRPALAGRLELRRCNRTKALSARSCRRARDYVVLARRQVTQTRRVTFAVAARPRSMGRYEIAYRPESKRFATTRQPFSVIRGFDGQIDYRPTVRRSPFGDR